MTGEAAHFEALLRQALTPVEPSADLIERLEGTLTSLTELAQEELDSWELTAMRDPRNWARPAAAVVVGTTAGAALVVLRARQRQKKRGGSNLGEIARRTARDVAEETLKLLDRTRR
ncbi:MAG: hypothetical protein QOI98_2496 [Solirubrobacteraceae bacterium]|nr:hypothetical protein [Solirubrobacteraceae bacterium]